MWYLYLLFLLFNPPDWIRAAADQGGEAGEGEKHIENQLWQTGIKSKWANIAYR